MKHQAIKELIDLANEQGWRVTNQSGHYKFYSPDKDQPIVVHGSTPSDRRGHKNFRAQLKRSGLIVDPEKWKQRKKELKSIERQRDKLSSDPAVRSALGQLFAEHNLSARQIEAFCFLLAHGGVTAQIPKDGMTGVPIFPPGASSADPPAKCQCGRTFMFPIALASHVYDHETKMHKPGHEPVWLHVDADDRPADADDDEVVVDFPDDPPAPPDADETAPPPDPDPTPPPPDPDPPAAPRAADRGDPTEDELFALLEMVLDGPVTLDRETYSAVNAWMEATRTLLRIRHSR